MRSNDTEYAVTCLTTAHPRCGSGDGRVTQVRNEPAKRRRGHDRVAVDEGDDIGSRVTCTRVACGGRSGVVVVTDHPCGVVRRDRGDLLLLRRTVVDDDDRQVGTECSKT